jgi:hypothetical protein
MIEHQNSKDRSEQIALGASEMRTEGSQRCNLWITHSISVRALEVRVDVLARLQRAVHFSTGPDVSRLATFFSPLPRR